MVHEGGAEQPPAPRGSIASRATGFAVGGSVVRPPGRPARRAARRRCGRGRYGGVGRSRRDRLARLRLARSQFHGDHAGAVVARDERDDQRPRGAPQRDRPSAAHVAERPRPPDSAHPTQSIPSSQAPCPGSRAPAPATSRRSRVSAIHTIAPWASSTRVMWARSDGRSRESRTRESAVQRSAAEESRAASRRSACAARAAAARPGGTTTAGALGAGAVSTTAGRGVVSRRFSGRSHGRRAARWSRVSAVADDAPGPRDRHEQERHQQRHRGGERRDDQLALAQVVHLQPRGGRQRLPRPRARRARRSGSPRAHPQRSGPRRVGAGRRGRARRSAARP